MNTFSKDEFKKEVNDYVKMLSRKTIKEASQLDLYQGVAYALKDFIIDQWIETHKEYEKQDAKTVYYLSMEFLTGRALGNIIINLSARDDIKEAIEELGLDFSSEDLILYDSGCDGKDCYKMYFINKTGT